MEISVLGAVLLVLSTAFFGYQSITHTDAISFATSEMSLPATESRRHSIGGVI
jgi:AhpD family alkylhydroperoxidase